MSDVLSACASGAGADLSLALRLLLRLMEQRCSLRGGVSLALPQR